MRRLVLFALAICSTTAAAVPLEISHQGRLWDALGTPLNGDHDVSFALYDDPATGTQLWSETHVDLGFDNGYFAAGLGTVTALELDDFPGDVVYLAIAVDGGSELATRIPVVSVPYALKATMADSATSADSASTADTATNLSGGTVDASSIVVGGSTVIDGSGVLNVTEIQVNGTTVIDGSGAFPAGVAWTDVSGVPADLADGDGDALGALGAAGSCTDGQVVTYQSGAWVCADDADTVDPNTDALADLAGSCSDGEAVVWNDSAGAFECASVAEDPNPANRRCETGWVDLGPTCINPDFSRTADWYGALDTCFAEGAKLCVYDELMYACENQGGLGLSFPDSTYIYLNRASLRYWSNGQTYVGMDMIRSISGSCRSNYNDTGGSGRKTSWTNPTTVQPFACCRRK